MYQLVYAVCMLIPLELLLGRMAAWMHVARLESRDKISLAEGLEELVGCRRVSNE